MNYIPVSISCRSASNMHLKMDGAESHWVNLSVNFQWNIGRKKKPSLRKADYSQNVMTIYNTLATRT